MMNPGMRQKVIVRIALVTASILALPLIATQFSDEVDWNLTDFAIGGALLFVAGLTYELIAFKSGNTACRIAIGVAVFASLLLTWANLAVGLIGDETNPANLMYVGVLAIGIIGAIIARLRPAGMARVLFAMALAQAAIAVIAIAAGLDTRVMAVLVMNGFFVALFAGSALLFRHTARRKN